MSDEKTREEKIKNALINSPQVLIEKSLKGWKEMSA